MENACKARPDITVLLPIDPNGNEWRIIKGEGEPPEEVMKLAYLGRR